MLKCFVLGHSWRESGQFRGGACFRCGRCSVSHTSFAGCDGYRASDDTWMRYTRLPIWKRLSREART
jgi:hypothetical protein